MDQTEFTRLQNALAWVFAPVIKWLLALMTAGGFFSGVYIIWLGLLRWLSKRS